METLWGDQLLPVPFPLLLPLAFPAPLAARGVCVTVSQADLSRNLLDALQGSFCFPDKKR